MDNDLPHKENMMKCLWISMLGKLDSQLVRLNLKKQRTQLSCHEFAELMQDFIDKELTTEERLLFKKQQEKCQGCDKKYHLEKETIELIRNHLEKPPLPHDLEALIRSKILYS